MMKNDKYMADAVFTLEMSIVFPIVFMVIIANILFAYYVHDRAKMQACAYNSLLESAYNNDNLKNAADEEKNKIFPVVIADIVADCDGDAVTFKGQVRTMKTLFNIFDTGTVCETKRFIPKMKKRYMYIFKEAKELIDKNTVKNGNEE